MSYYEPPARERWNRDRFDRVSRGGPSERDYYRFQEREQRGRGRAEVLLDERIDRRGPRGRYDEHDVYYEEDRYQPGTRRMTFLEEPVAAERAGVALAPYRRPRPQFIRRQSSLDTFDRRPMPRYGDEYRLPPEVPIPLPITRPSPPRQRFYEDYEARYRGPEEDYEDVRIREERKGNHREESRMRSRSVVRRRRESSSSSSSSASSFDEVKKTTIIGKKGRTRMPKRLAHRSAMIKLGLPFEEEDDFIIVHRALEKKHIDEIIEISKSYRENDSISYKYEGLVIKDPKEEEEEVEEKDERKVEREKIKREEIRPDGTRRFEEIEKEKEVDKEEIKEEVKEREPEPKEDEVIRRTKTITTIIDPPEHHHHHQDLAVMAPRYRDEHQLRREIKALEAERRALRSERGSVYESERDYEVERGSRDVIRVERDRKVRERSRPAHPKLVGLAMASLT